MHPALSVIFFTTLSGAGYGLAAILSLGLLSPEWLTTKFGFFLALALISIGLLSSTLHLGNPQRAWRAFSQWRSSWLSREGVLAIVTFIPLTLQAFLVIFYGEFHNGLGIITAILCLSTVFSTSMIYASLRTIASWCTPLTPLNYLLFSLSSGGVIALVLAALAGTAHSQTIWIVAAAIAIAWLAKWFWAKRTSTIETGSSNIATATGLGGLGKVRLLEPPHMMGNYLTKEMGYRIARKHNTKLWNIASIFGLLVPVVILASLAATGSTAVVLILVAAMSHMVGLLVERWLFFANAKHAVSLYYDM